MRLKSIDSKLLLIVSFDDLYFSHIFDVTLGIKDDNFEVRKEIVKTKIPKTKVIDLILLGGNSLLSANNQNPQAMTRNIGDSKLGKFKFDQIYNINLDYNYRFGKNGKNIGKVNDKKSDEDLYTIFGQNDVSDMSIRNGDQFLSDTMLLILMVTHMQYVQINFSSS